MFVRGFQRLRDLLGDGEGFIDRDGPLRDAIPERRPLDQFHHQRDSARALFEAVNLRDVRMIERGKRSRFAIKSCQPFGILRDRLGQYFDRHVATEVGVRRPIHLPHSAFTNLGGDLIWTEAGAGLQGHRLVQRHALDELLQPVLHHDDAGRGGRFV